jgi:hypothetical protein
MRSDEYTLFPKEKPQGHNMSTRERKKEKGREKEREGRGECTRRVSNEKRG